MNIKDLLIKHENIKNKPYDDSTGKELKQGDTIKGKVSIGVGRNIQDNGLSEDEIIYLLSNDIERCITELKTIFPKFDELPKNIRMALIDMNFNLGKSKFLTFKKMIQAVKNRDWKQMIEEMKDSKWCEQLPNRCKDDVSLIEETL